MRLAVYAGTSSALAAGVVLYAFNQRTNFYSACVYLAQSNLCLMILTNLILLLIASFMFGLQRMFYGPLRPIEIEQLYEKGWFAVTETCLAMTIFREEVGVWFLVMFVALLAGKVWAWIGEGRVEVLEQQPPSNPRLFHLRLSFSLALSLLYDLWVMVYTVKIVIQRARPNMMVMFLFEFAVLMVSSISTIIRYGISLIEARIVKNQTQERLESRRREIRDEREQILRQRASTESNAESSNPNELAQTPALPTEDDVDEMDIEVPGWEAKGHWVLTLDLITDLLKLAIYTAFFFILLTFYGLPIHIMRDLFLTARSFVKRLSAFLRYRRATHDMNEKYPDASVEEIQREDTCIICREEMRPWSVTNPVEPANAPANGRIRHSATRPAHASASERTRPKKLPCGHILHLGCLKSWLERQQVCPTCRRSVVETVRLQPTQAQRPGQAPVVGQGQNAGGAAGGVPGAQAPAPPNGGMRMLNIGPIRLGFGQANVQDLVQQFGGAQAVQRNAAGPGAPRIYGLELGFPRLQPQPHAPAAAPNGVTPPIPAQLQEIEERIMQDIMALRVNQQELQIVQLLQAELTRLRSLHANTTTAHPAGGPPHVLQPGPANTPFVPFSSLPSAPPNMQAHEVAPGVSPIPSGSPELPPGVTIPEGWALLPLQRLDEQALNAQARLGLPIGNPGVSLPTPGRQPTTNVTAPRSNSAPGTSRSISMSPAFRNTSSSSAVTSPMTTRFETIFPNQLGTSNSNGSVMNVQPSPPTSRNWGTSQSVGNTGSSSAPHSNSIFRNNLPSRPPEEYEKSTTVLEGADDAATQSRDVSQDETVDGLGSKGKARAATVEDSNEDA